MFSLDAMPDLCGNDGLLAWTFSMKPILVAIEGDWSVELCIFLEGTVADCVRRRDSGLQRKCGGMCSVKKGIKRGLLSQTDIGGDRDGASWIARAEGYMQ